MLACHEVAHYGHICDVLAIDRNKKLIFEYEFKNNSHDLKVAEFNKDKYKPEMLSYKNEISKSRHYGKYVYKDWKVPHYFYFVVPEELYEKEKEFLKSLKVGTISYRNNPYGHIEDKDFYVVKRTTERKKNTQSYEVASKSLTKRLANLYAFKN